MPISVEDKPVCVVHDQMNPLTPYVILDAKGTMRAQFVDKNDADLFVAKTNGPEPESGPKQEPALMQENMNDTGVERDQEDREQQEEDDMPRGIPNVKAAAKKRAASAKTKVKKRAATAVKKTAKKFADKVKKRKTRK